MGKDPVSNHRPSANSSSKLPELPTQVNPETLERLQWLGYVLDNAIPIPGTNYRVGLDPLLGLLPAGGDVISGVLSAYIVLESARAGVSRKTLWQMVFNILMEVLVGSVPALGDLFDASWKANARNISLLESHLALPQSSPRADRKFSILLMVVLALIILLSVSISALLLWLVISAFGG